MPNIIKLFRPHQWIKNLFIITPWFFTFKYNTTDLINTLLGVFLFSLTASSIYVLNDYHDIDEDRQHPIKCNRPLASGAVTKKQAIFLILLLWGSVAIGSYLLNPIFSAIALSYVAINILYTLKLKHIAILDVIIIATGFVLRVFAGASLINVRPSTWIVLVTFLLAIFLALAKRRDDCLLARDGLKVRKNIDGYNLELVNAAMVLMAAVTLVSYIMYTVSPEVIQHFGNEYLYLTSLFVIMGILRYMQITFVEDNSGNPTKVLLKDHFLQLTITGWVVSFILVQQL